jgi:hypothetical protein
MKGDSEARPRFVPTTEQLKAQRHAADYAPAKVLGLAWYKQYPGDNLCASRGWSAAVVGVYHILRDIQWDCGSLPVESEDIRRLAGIQPRDWRAAWPLVQSHFPIDHDGRRRNPELANQRHESIGQRWQKVDASNTRHHEGWYRGKSADLYLAGERSDGLPHQHQRRQERAYGEGGIEEGLSLAGSGEAVRR